jgi:hypothetical protein
MAEIVVVEHVFDPPLTNSEHDRISALVDRCAEMRNARWLRTYLSADRTRSFCEFEAPDAESVRDAYRNAGVPFLRAWSAELFKR